MRGINVHIKQLTAIVVSLLFLVSFANISAKTKGQYIGGINTEYPDWFKTSFLELPDDIDEATEAGKRLVLIFYQDGCPYCNALVERNFAQKNIVEKAKKNFDFIAINIWGDRPIVHVDGQEYVEKTYAEAMKVQFTPTVVFFNEQGEVVYRINGYHAPQRFNLELDYVTKHKQTKVSYRDFMIANRPKTKISKTLNDESFFSKTDYDYSNKASQKSRPFAVFFEQKDCPDCDYLHNKVLPDKKLQSVINQFDNTQLDIWSKTVVITPEGKKMTAREWAKKLDIKFAPTLVIFNKQGKEKKGLG